MIETEVVIFQFFSYLFFGNKKDKYLLTVTLGLLHSRHAFAKSIPAIIPYVR